MQPEISELIVLQIIHTLLVLQSPSSGSVGVISGKVSLVRLTNEIQNNVLVNQMVERGEDKLDINDILVVVKRVFPNQRISLVDGQLSFHNLQLTELQNGIRERLHRFCHAQQAAIARLEDDILNPQRRTAAGGAGGGTNVDPKREKLLQLYRDTVLNKLQAKSGGKMDLQTLYETLNASGALDSAVRQVIEIDRIKNDTPSSVHDLQLVIQKSICDGVMSCETDTDTWLAARQLQAHFDDTVQFMRRALE
ncbi:hypothetical protein HG536_0G03590 [Torulaspora globosa]|uniref:Uncharacterized protein n=1 Tax=Torulaspora globosa TaxID=48254 RepID=A0A7G3ZLW1_9SACH|nr:uncharacterized protein HG536_0G03590 [Torulaspora globosa]QLL34497.1 hypothetical protein HG536_0G03590 [Torulaspora globosa]